MKKCACCKTNKEKIEFNRAKRNKDGLQTFCRQCQRLVHSRYQQNNKSKLSAYQKEFNKQDDKFNLYQKKYWLKQRYGIDLQTYNEMIARQNNLCAICKRPESSVDKRYNKLRTLAVDHDHRSGKIRELLCTSCNLFVGQVENDVSRFQNVLIYLDKHRIK